jgi:MmyB-like transcription regulator ligand binding domain
VGAHDIEVGGTPTYTFNHPLVGAFTVAVERFGIIGAEGQLLIVHHADPGSPSERALSILAGMADRTRGDRRRDCPSQS